MTQRPGNLTALIQCQQKKFNIKLPHIRNKYTNTKRKSNRTEHSKYNIRNKQENKVKIFSKSKYGLQPITKI